MNNSIIMNLNINVSKCTVLESGWLWSRDFSYPGDPTCGRKYVEALSKASKGEDPGMYDNSSFHRVDPKYAGQVMYLRYLPDMTEIAFLPSGERVQMVEEQPLSFARWGKERPEPIISRDDWPDYLDP